MAHKRSRVPFSHGNDFAEEDSSQAPAAPQDPLGYYAALGVTQDASPQAIRQAFLHLSQHYHTDKHVNQAEEMQQRMTQRFQELQEAYSVLSDDARRAAYDAAGPEGESCLDLIPADMRKRPDIIGIIRAQEREARVIRTAKMLSATSDVTASFSVAHFFASPHAADAPEEAADEDPTSELPAPRSPQTAASSADTPQQSAADELPAAASPAAGTSTQMMAKEVMLDGQPQIVLIPSEALQSRLRERLHAARPPSSPSAEVDGAVQSPPSLAEQRLGRAVEYLMIAAIPRTLRLRHSFQHVLSERVALFFRTDAQSVAGSPASKVRLAVSTEYQRSPVVTYSATVQGSVHGVKLTTFRERVLNELWTLRTKFTWLNGLQLLHKLELTLERKLSQLAALENTIAWSMYNSGFFRSSLTSTGLLDQAERQHGLVTTIGYHNMNVSAFLMRPEVFVPPSQTMTRAPVRGRLQYTLSCSVLTGQSTIGYELWYYHSALQHYGLGFTTVVPYALSPLGSPPLFLAGSTPATVVNQITLLYARGTHRIAIPVVLLVSPNLRQSFLWLSVPLCALRLGQLACRPLLQARAARYYTRERMAHVAEVDIAREEALMEQKALEVLCQLCTAAEDRKGGLVIVNAQYGVLRPMYTSESADVHRFARSKLGGLQGKVANVVARAVSWVCARWPARLSFLPTTLATVSADEEDSIPLTFDVTIALQNLVRDSALQLPAGTKSKLVGFCDPDPYTPELKQLSITYWFRKKLHSIIIDDDDPLDLPQRQHLSFS